MIASPVNQYRLCLFSYNFCQNFHHNSKMKKNIKVPLFPNKGKRICSPCTEFWKPRDKICRLFIISTSK